MITHFADMLIVLLLMLHLASGKAISPIKNYVQNEAALLEFRPICTCSRKRRNR